MQGRLRNEALSIFVNTECAQTGEPLHIEIDSELNFHVEETNADPHLYVPLVDFEKLRATNIIDAF